MFMCMGLSMCAMYIHVHALQGQTGMGSPGVAVQFVGAGYLQ